MHLTLEKKRSVAGMLFMVPAMVMTLSMLIYPLLYSFYLSFAKYNVLYDVKPVLIGLENYKAVFTDPLFLNALKITFVFAGWSVLLGVGIPVILALLLNSTRGKLKVLYETILYLPIVVPGSLSLLVFYIMLAPRIGYVSQSLEQLFGMHFAWNATGSSTLATLIAVSQWTLGYQVVILVASLKDVDQELLDAAFIDGANTWQRTIHVVLPQIRHTISVVAILATIGGFKTFVQPMVMTGGGPNHATETLYFRLYKVGFEMHQMGYASAMAYTLSFIIIIFSLLNLRFFGGKEQ